MALRSAPSKRSDRPSIFSGLILLLALGAFTACVDPDTAPPEAIHRAHDRTGYGFIDGDSDKLNGPTALVVPSIVGAQLESKLDPSAGDAEGEDEPTPTPSKPTSPVDEDQPVQQASVRISPSPATITKGERLRLRASSYDAKGRQLPTVETTWWTSDPRIATIAGDGTLLGVTPGEVDVGVSVSGVQGSARVQVTTAPVHRITLSHGAPTELPIGEGLRLQVAAFDAAGNLLSDRAPVSWTSSAPAVASVDDAGLVSAVSVGSARITAAIEGRAASIEVDSVLRFTSLTAGQFHTCGVTTSGAAYCWGSGTSGQLGAGGVTVSSKPVPVVGGYRFSSLSTRADHSCGVIVGGGANNAFCWGRNAAGQLGNGANDNSNVPMKVAGGIAFDSITAGVSASCGLSVLGEAFCWGAQTGTSWPDPVPGIVGYTDLVMGGGHVCGLGSEGLRCWGENSQGQVDPSGSWPDPVPARILAPGDVSKRELVSFGLGIAHTCASSSLPGKEALVACWGDGRMGQLGGGVTTSFSLEDGLLPAAEIVQLVGGKDHSCGLASTGDAFCWGSNEWGQLGTGSDSDLTSLPTRIQGIQFRSLAAGAHHTCGVATDGDAYCWGRNTSRQLGLGVGSGSSVSTPQRVMSQHAARN